MAASALAQRFGKSRRRTVLIMTACKALALAALSLCGACSSFRFEPTAHWLRDGGRLCAADRDTFGLDYRPAAPGACAQAFSGTPSPLAGKREAMLHMREKA